MPSKMKEKVVTDIQEKFKTVGNVVISEYQGLNVQEISDLRNQLRGLRCEYKVLKNSLTKIALKNLGYEKLGEYIDGPIGVVFESGDPALISKLLVKFAKDHEKFRLKAGILNGTIIDQNQIKALAQLPSRQVLLARLASAVAGPLQALVNVLHAPIQGLTNSLDQLAKQKQ